MNEELVIPEADLPDWIRQAKRGVDWGVLIVLMLSLALGWSFILNEGLPRTSISESIVFRTQDTANALREGHLYPRWSPHAIYGYGAPIAHYYPPAPAYLPALINVLLTNDSVIAVRLTYLLAFILAGGATYALMLRRLDATAGVISALLFVYSPYFGLVTPHVMGDLQSMMGMALMPVWLWALDRVYGRNSALDMLWLALTTATVVLTDPTHFGFATFGLGVVLAGFHLYSSRTWQRILPSTLAIALGLAIGAFYWLPALAEMNAVQWHQLDTIPSLKMAFIPLFQPLKQPDMGAMNPSVQLTLGMATLFFVGVSTGVLLLMRQKFNFHIIMLVTGMVIMLGGIWLAPQSYWLVGVVSFCFALAGSGLIYLRPVLRRRKIARQYFVAIVIGILALSVNVWVSNRRTELLGDLSGNTQIRYEQQGFGVAVLPIGAPIPSNIPLEEPPNAQILQGYQNNLLNRIQADIRITDQISLVENTSQKQRYQVRLPNVLNSDIFLANWVGWQAYLNERLLDLRPNDALHSFTLAIPPSNNGELIIRLDDTPVQQLSWGLSFSALAIIIFITWRNSHHNYALNFSYSILLHVRDARLLSVAIIIITIFGVVANSTLLSRSLRLPRNYALGDVTPLNNRTNSAIEMIGYQINQTEFTQGQTLDLTLYWQANRTVEENYKIQLSLNNVENGQTVYTSDLTLLGNYPSKRWQANLYVIDQHIFTIPNNIPSGRYVLAMSVYPCFNRNIVCNTDQSLIFFDPSSNLIGRLFTLPRIITLR